MHRLARLSDIDAQHFGLAILTALKAMENGDGGEVDMELKLYRADLSDRLQARTPPSGGEIVPRWVRISIDEVNRRVVIYEIRGPWEEEIKDESD